MRGIQTWEELNHQLDYLASVAFLAHLVSFWCPAKGMLCPTNNLTRSWMTLLAYTNTYLCLLVVCQIATHWVWQNNAATNCQNWCFDLLSQLFLVQQFFFTMDDGDVLYMNTTDEKSSVPENCLSQCLKVCRSLWTVTIWSWSTRLFLVWLHHGYAHCFSYVCCPLLLDYSPTRIEKVWAHPVCYFPFSATPQSTTILLFSVFNLLI